MRKRRGVAAVIGNLGMNGAILTASFIVALFAAEFLIRLISPQQLISIRPDIWQPADTLGWQHRPHVRARINTGEREVHLFTDQEGFRVGRAGRVEAQRRILLLGDSFMEALQVEYEHSFAGLLESQLSDRLGEAVAVRNAAVVGWGPNQYLFRARQLLQRDTFDLLVVAVYLDNDVENIQVESLPPRAPVERKRFRLPRRLSWKELVQSFLAPINDMLEVRSHLFVLVKNRMEILRMRPGLMPPYYPVVVLRREASSDRWATTAELCRELADLAEAKGIPTLFVLIPAPYQVDAAVLEKSVRGLGLDPTAIDLEQPNRLLGRELSARQVTVLDALQEFRAAHADGRRLYGAVDRHMSPTGHEVLSSLVLPRVVELLEAHPGAVNGALSTSESLP